MRQLVSAGVIEVDHEAYGALRLTAAARPILKGETRVTLRRASEKKATRADRRKADAATRAADGTPDDARLFERLRARRAALAREQGVPPYMVFGDAALWSMVQLKPSTRDQMADVHGVGAEKLKRYGRDFLDVIDEWRVAEG